MNSKNHIKLSQPQILDFSRFKNNDDVRIVIKNTLHKFSKDAELSGKNTRNQPIFGCDVYINNMLFLSLNYGLPFMRFHQGSKPKITYENKTLFTFNIHYHGLNTVGSVDGASMEAVFGHSTQLGSIVTFQFPEITNNQSLLWFHNHNMFISMELIYSGAVGLLQIVDKQTQWLIEEFKYGNNQILLEMLDMDFTDTGTQTNVNLVTDENRSCFTVINGISAVNWYSDDNVPFVNKLYHKSSRNLVKIDILNASLNWRVFHIGVCDEDMNIKSFYLVQTDTGLMNPKKLEMTFIPVGSRIGIIIDLSLFKNGIANLFLYNYELTEIFNSELTFPNEPNNTSITATIPIFNQYMNSTPYPSPIPDENQENQQQDYTNLNYPKINLIAQTEQELKNGSIKIPKKFTKKPFLKIIWEQCNKSDLSLCNILSKIRQTIFGCETYKQYKDIIKQSSFEYDPKFNYLSFLNPKYYFNLPKFNIDVPTRNFLLFSEVNTNAIASGNINGTTEFINGANRIMVDLWNSSELNLEWSLQEYIKSPNNYKTSILPTSKFRIYKTNDEYSNTAMISNDTLEIQFFTNQITYGDFSQQPLANVIIVFPPTEFHLNIQQWIDLVNNTFSETNVIINNRLINLGDILICDWSFFPYQYNYMYNKTLFIKSAIIKTINTSNFWIRYIGRWPLLQFFGKPMTGDTLDIPPNMRTSKSQYMKCDEYGIYGIYDSDIRRYYPMYHLSMGFTKN